MNEDWEANNKKTYNKMKKNHLLQWDYIDKYIDEQNIKSILDVGCGEIQHIGFSSEWVGIDVNSTIKNEKVIHGDFFNYKFDREFDMVLIAGVVEHYDNETFEKFLDSALKVNPKHILITLFMRIREKDSKLFKYRSSYGLPHIRCKFGRNSIKRIMEKYNLNYSIEKIDNRSHVIVIRRNSNG